MKIEKNKQKLDSMFLVFCVLYFILSLNYLHE